MTALVMVGGPLDGATLVVHDIPRRVLIHADDQEVLYRLLELQPADQLVADRLQYVPDDGEAEAGGLTGQVEAVLDALQQFQDSHQHRTHEPPPPERSRGCS